MAERKVALFHGAGARIRCIAPAFSAAIRSTGGIELVDATVLPEPDSLEPFLQGSAVVIAATDDAEVNEAVAFAARRQNIPVNVVDTPALCDFYVPAIVRRGDVVIGIGTAGVSPGLSRVLRERLEGFVGEDVAHMARLQEQLRKELRPVTDSPGERKDLLLTVLYDDETWRLLREDRFDEALMRARKLAGHTP